jgi:hypothetical protein
MRIAGNLIVRAGDKRDYSLLVEVDGYVDVQQGATLTAPALVEVDGYVDVRQGATLTAPALAKCGSVYARQGATLTAPALAKCGSVDVQQGATFTAPALVEVDGYLFCEGVFEYSKIKFTAGEIIAISGYALHHKNGCLTAGCRDSWSYEKALNHWNASHDNQERARIFSAAIKVIAK